MNNRLPETELANWSFLPVDQKKAAALAFAAPKRIGGSYEPFRHVFSDAVSQQAPLFGFDQPRASPWTSIEGKLRRLCRRSDELLTMNLAVARATHEFATASHLFAVPVEVTALGFGVGHLYQYGLPLMIRYPSRVAIVFLDLRRSNNLNSRGIEWVNAALFERFQAAYPDYQDAEREIWRYSSRDDRAIRVISLGQPIITFEQMAQDARETYDIYNTISRSSVHVRKDAAGQYAMRL